MILVINSALFVESCVALNIKYHCDNNKFVNHDHQIKTVFNIDNASRRLFIKKRKQLIFLDVCLTQPEDKIMSDSNKLFSSTAGKQVQRATIAGAAVHTATLLTGTVGTAFPLAPVIAPAILSLPLVLGVRAVAYGVYALWDRLFD